MGEVRKGTGLRASHKSSWESPPTRSYAPARMGSIKQLRSFSLPAVAIAWHRAPRPRAWTGAPLTRTHASTNSQDGRACPMIRPSIGQHRGLAQTLAGIRSTMDRDNMPSCLSALISSSLTSRASSTRSALNAPSAPAMAATLRRQLVDGTGWPGSTHCLANCARQRGLS
jgi:hypothetical protein